MFYKLFQETNPEKYLSDVQLWAIHRQYRTVFNYTEIYFHQLISHNRKGADVCKFLSVSQNATHYNSKNFQFYTCTISESLSIPSIEPTDSFQAKVYRLYLVIRTLYRSEIFYTNKQ